MTAGLTGATNAPLICLNRLVYKWVQPAFPGP
jgi:hypothetical protein